MNKNGDNPLSVYIVVSHVSFVVITPLLLFIWGGSWLAKRFNLPDWCIIVFIITGILVMICSLISYLYKIIKKYSYDKSDKSGENEDNPHYKRLKNDRRDYDYYYENHEK